MSAPRASPGAHDATRALLGLQTRRTRWQRALIPLLGVAAWGVVALMVVVEVVVARAVWPA